MGGAQTPASANEGCSNEALRIEQGSTMLDCRAYELVTPSGSEPYVQTSGFNIGEAQGVQAARDGGSLAWFTFYAPANSATPGPYYLSRRAEASWPATGVIPPQSTETGIFCLPLMLAYSPDLSFGLLADGPEPGRECGRDDPPLASEEPVGVQNLFVRDEANGTSHLVDVTPPGIVPSYPIFQAASEDLGHVVFDEASPLTPGAPSGEDVYVWSRGAVHLVTVLNGPGEGTPVVGDVPWAVSSASVSPGGANFTHVVSRTGGRIFFESEGKLYVRENADQQQSPLDGEGRCTNLVMACTVQLDKSASSGSGGGGRFRIANVEGSNVFFTADASSGLTSDTVAGSGANLYRWEVIETETKREYQLTDITPSAHAEVEGVLGASDDGSYVYFVSGAALASGASSGQPNLYLWHDGIATYVATLSSRMPSPGDQISRHTEFDYCDWLPSCETARVSPDGRFLAFNSVRSLTGYDNAPTNPAVCDESPESPSDEPCSEVYLYDASTGLLSCASCDPNGAPPTGPAGILPPEQDTATWSGHAGYLQRNLTDDGRLFFNSPDALVLRDSNGLTDLYEYEAGRVQLVSSGTSADGSYLADASANGEDVFFFTAQSLVGWDSDNAFSIYDARTNGGFVEPLSTTSCADDGCRRVPAGPPSFSDPASISFTTARTSVAVVGGHAHKRRRSHKHHRMHKRSHKRRPRREHPRRHRSGGPK